MGVDYNSVSHQVSEQASDAVRSEFAVSNTTKIYDPNVIGVDESSAEFKGHIKGRIDASYDRSKIIPVSDAFKQIRLRRERRNNV